MASAGEEKLDKKIFAWALKEAAGERGITQEALAEELGISRNGVSHMFTEQRFPSIPTLIGMCKALGTSPDNLLAGYLNDTSYLAEDEYHKLLKLADSMEPNELALLFRIIEVIIKNRK